MHNSLMETLTQPGLMSELVTFMLKFDLVDVTLVRHQCTSLGRCAACTSYVVPDTEWPCTSYKAAAQARQMRGLHAVESGRRTG